MTMTKVGASAPSGSQTTTTFQIGTYNALTDTFTQLLDLNDQVTYFLRPGNKQQSNPEFSQKTTTVRAQNVRASGSLVIKDVPDNNILTTMCTIKATTEQGVSDAWNAVVKVVNSVRSKPRAAGGAQYTLRFAWPKSTGYSYLDIRNIAISKAPGNPLEMLAKAQTGLVLAIEGDPEWRWDQLRYQNLVPNPGFEYPIGGALAPAVLGFSDTFANVNAYAVQAGGAPTTAPANVYTDIVFAQIGSTLLRYYRLGLADDATHAYDISGNGWTGTPTGSPTQGVAGGISGDTDTCYTFAAASSQYVDCPTVGLPTGNTAIAFGGRMKYAAAPGGSQYLWTYGAGGGGNHNYIGLFLDTAGKLNADVGAATVQSAALTTATWHDYAVTWDGTTLRLYVDGASVGTPATPGAQTIPTSSLKFRIAATANTVANLFFSGQIDDVWVASSAIGATPISNLRTAGATGATGTLSNAMSVPAAARVAFGSPAWGGMQTWQVRFRYATSQVGQWYLHYTDANNNLAARVQSGANGFGILHRIAGVTTTVVQTTAPLQHEAWYWLKVTQFPTVANVAPWVTAALYYDSNGSIGTQLASLTQTQIADAVTAQIGKPQINPTGAALVVGGKSDGTGLAWYNWGPCGWLTSLNSGTGNATAVYDGANLFMGMSGNGGANTYTGGPVTSFGAARIDAAPAGTLNAKYQLYTGGTAAGTWALPVATAGDVLEIAAACITNSVSATATLKLSVTEYNAAGTSLRTDTGWTPPSKTAAQAASWTTLSGNYTTGASCAYVDLACVVADSTANSAGNAFWFDNVQCQDATATSITGMPYCELRMPNSPAQLMVSGLLGDTPAPCMLAMGIFEAAPATNTLQWVVGRKKHATTKTQLVWPASAQGTSGPLLDAGSPGGYYHYSATPTVFSPFGAAVYGSDMEGTYHLYSRCKTDATTTANVQVNAYVNQIDPAAPTSAILGQVGTQLIAGFLSPFGTSTWGMADTGQVLMPLGTLSGLTDASKWPLQATFIVDDTNGLQHNAYAAGMALLPVDGGVLAGQVGGFTAMSTNEYLWLFSDGMGGQIPSMSYYRGTMTAGPGNVALASGIAYSVGSTTASAPIGTLSLTTGADPYLELDPRQQISGVGVNHLCAWFADTIGTIFPAICEVVYSPYSRYPR